MEWKVRLTKWAVRNRCPGEGWHLVVDYLSPCPEFPHLDVWVCAHDRSRETRLFLVCGFHVLWSLRCPPRSEWIRSFQETECDAMRFVRQALQQKDKVVRSMAAQSLAWMERYPALWEYLVTDTWDTGEVRITSMLCVFYEDGCFKFVLQDRENERSLWVTGPDTDTCLESLDHKLANAVDSEWRAAKGKGKGFKKKS